MIDATMAITGTQMKNKMVPMKDQLCNPSSKMNFFNGNKPVVATPTPNKAASTEIVIFPKTIYTNAFMNMVMVLPKKCKQPFL